MKTGFRRFSRGGMGVSSRQQRTGRLAVENLEARHLLAGDVVINELVASNQTTLETHNGKTPDWIELHNRGAETVDLEGWQLKDRGDVWTFPAGIAIESDQYLIVFASGDDHIVTEPTFEIHTNFKLKKDGEYLGLINPDGVITNEFNPYPPQESDGAYGLARGETFAQFFTTATPGAENPRAPEVFITEFMSSNQGTLADEDGDFADWIELYNDGEAPANLNGWVLESDGIEWEFPEVVLPSKEFLIVFASGNDRSEADEVLHTNFKLGSSFDELYLFRTDGEVASEFFYPPQQADVSYGLTVDFSEEQFFVDPTPGAPNLTDYDGVRFNHPSGFYQRPFQLNLTTEAENAIIRYTTDGTRPTESNGIVFENPIQISESSVVRAATFRAGMEPIESTRSYLLLESIVRQNGRDRPQTWGFIADYDMDPNVVAQDRSIVNRLSWLPGVSITVEPDDLFSIKSGIYANPLMEGSEWEKPVYVEFLGDGNERITSTRLDATGMIKVSGHIAERNPASTSKFGMEISFDQNLRPEETGATLFDSKSNEFDGLVLRSGHVDSWLGADSEQRTNATYSRDRFILESFRDMGRPSLASRSVNVFVNGMYWGVYHMTERPSAETVSEHLGGKPTDYDVVFDEGTIAGNSSAWDRLLELANEDLSNPEAFESVTRLVDVESLADFILLKRFAGISDDAQQSWFAARNADDQERFQFFFLNNEQVLDIGGETQEEDPATTTLPFYAPEFIFQQLSANDQFVRLFGDRVHMHLTGEGALTADKSRMRWNSVYSETQAAIQAESARWGDYRENVAAEGEEVPVYGWPDMSAAIERVTGHLLERTNLLTEELQGNELYPDVEAPTFPIQGGIVDNGYRLQIQSSAGSVYFTTDGSDPLNADGSLSDDAQLYESAVALHENTIIRTRAKEGNQWSALSQATFVMRDGLPLRFTEIMYHPNLEDPNSPFDDDDFEFIEIQNVGETTVLLNGLNFNDGIDFQFDDGRISSLDAGEFVLVVKNETAFATRYDTSGLKIAGEYGGQLNNGGEQIRLVDAFGQEIEELEYSDQWYSLTDGAGFTLVRKDPTSGPGYGQEQFEVSQVVGGTPGVAESLLDAGSIVINEVMSNSNDPQGDWIELLNTTSDPIDVSGWFLSDSSDQLRKYQISENQILPAGEFLLFHQADHFGNSENASQPFDVDAAGESLFLSSSDTQGRLGGYREQITLGSAVQDISMGRIAKLDGTVDYVSLRAATPGSENASPFVGPVIINEIMHSPTTGEEYIELLNVTNQPVEVFDPFHPDQTWKLSDGVRFRFPAKETIPASAYVLIVNSDPEIFRERNGLAEDAIIYGPYRGSLRNEGEALGLYRATSTGNEAETTYSVVDRVVYDDARPWPSAAKEGGSSIQRRASDLYANDAANWMPSFLGGTPGSENIGIDESARNIPFVDDFAVNSIDQLKGWRFTSGYGGQWQVEHHDANGQLYSQTHQADPCRICDADDYISEAILAIDIQDDSELGLVFTTEALPWDLTISVSDDQRNWYSAVDGLNWSTSSGDISFGLSDALARNGLQQQGVRYVRFAISGQYGGYIMDDISIAPGDVIGPWVEEHTIISEADGSLSGIEVVFDEPINPTTFSTSRIRITDPVGNRITPTSIESDDALHWTVSLPNQKLAGTYRFELTDRIADPSGNRLNPFDYSIDKRSPSRDSYLAEFKIDASTPAGFQSTQDFEAGDISTLSPFEFATFGRSKWNVTSDDDPAFGNYHLQSLGRADNNPNTADLLIDLSNQQNATDLSLDFWARTAGDVGWTNLEVSNGENEWKTIAGIQLAEQYQHHSVDLDQALNRLGINLSELIRIRFIHWTWNHHQSLYLDNIRLSNVDVFGPAIETASIIANAEPPISSFDISFNEEIDASTLNANTLTIEGPVGNDLPIQSIATEDNRSFRIAFDEQFTPGTYSYTIKSDVTDSLGNPMNQNGNLIGGQEDTIDGYLGEFSVRLTPTHEFPYQQSFEVDSILDLDGWAFASRGPGSWQLEQNDKAKDGAYVLRGTQSDQGYLKQSAILSLDLADQRNADILSLSFWAKSDHSHGSGRLFISDDGDRWQYVTHIANDRQFVLHAIDLKSEMFRLGIGYDDDVRIKFEYESSRSGTEHSLEQIQINNSDVIGPKIISNSPLHKWNDDQSAVIVTFDKPIDSSSFTTDDVQLALTRTRVTVNEIVPIDDRNFRIVLETPATAGNYELRVGPNILDNAGIPMNQLLDAFSGTLSDTYSSSVFVPLDPISTPYNETFSVSSVTRLAGWMFTGNRWQTTKSYEPMDDRHLSASKQGDCWEDFVATLSLDVTPYLGRTDLVLEFDMKRTSKEANPRTGSRDFTRLLIGSDNNNFTQVGYSGDLLNDDGARRFSDINDDGILDLAPVHDVYTHYGFDLDQMIQAAGAEGQGTIQLQFLRVAFYGTDVTVFDNIRIYSKAEAGGLQVENVELQEIGNEDLNAVEGVTIAFDKPVLGFELSDLQLTRNGGANLLPRNATLTSADHQVWHLSQLEHIINMPGEYSLTLDASAAGIVNLIGDPLTDGIAESWIDVRSSGDANLDGVFNSRDLVMVFQAGEYEDGENNNSDWSRGDWNGDRDFTSGDLVRAFQEGDYSTAATADQNAAAAIDQLFKSETKAELDRMEVDNAFVAPEKVAVELDLIDSGDAEADLPRRQNRIEKANRMEITDDILETFI